MTGQGAPGRDQTGPRTPGGTQRKPRHQGLRGWPRPAALAAAVRGWQALAAGLACAGLMLAAGSGTAVARTTAARPASAPAGRPVPAASGWHAVRAPLPPGATGNPLVTLKAVACHGASRCAAVGDYVDAAGHSQGLLLTRSGTRWTAAKAPFPKDAFSDPSVDPTSVACPSTSSCVVAASYATLPGFQGLLLTGWGKTWHLARAPLPPDADKDNPAVSIYELACPSTTSCVAVASYMTSAQQSRGLILTGSGTSWTATEMPVPSDAARDPESVLFHATCASAGTCVISGLYDDKSHNRQGVLLTGSGTSWTLKAAPAPAGASTDAHSSFEEALACPKVTVCTGAGSYSLPSFSTRGTILTGLGTSWTPAKIPVPSDVFPGNAAPAFDGASCPGTQHCVFSGTYQVRGSNASHSVLLSGIGASWKATKAPVPSGGLTAKTVNLSDVACALVSACASAGWYIAPNHGQEGLLLTGSGTSWHPFQAPLPANAATKPGVHLFAVTCPSRSSCLAVGYYLFKPRNWEGGLLLSGPA
jgi:hypothetical protein